MVSQYEIDVIEKGIALSWTTWGKMSGETLTQGDISYLKSDTGKGFERIFSIRLTGEDPDFRVQQMIMYIKAGILPDSMLITPNTRPADLAERLSQKGFGIDTSGSCMMMRLDDYVDQPSGSDRIQVVPVREPKQLRTWIDIVNEALFGCELVTIEQFTGLLHLENLFFYLGFLDDEAVTSCMTIMDGDTSVLEMVATREAYRRKGTASAAIDRAITDLRHKGVKTISLRAETDGIQLYKRLGFRECFVRIVAFCDWEQIYQKACPCRIADDRLAKAKEIFHQSADVPSFVREMDNQHIIGKHIWYEADEKAIYITKLYACDCGGGCPSNDTLIGQRCHCEYINHISGPIPLSYCKSAAAFFGPMFQPLFGENILIEPVKTVLSGGDECVFRITLPPMGKVDEG